MGKVKITHRLLADCLELRVHQANATWLRGILETRGFRVADAGTIPDTPLIRLRVKSVPAQPLDTILKFLNAHVEIES
jgi:hypothetical protein